MLKSRPQPSAPKSSDKETQKSKCKRSGTHAGTGAGTIFSAFLHSLMKVILFQPQIPQNTGNIVRTCAVTGCDLILVRPLGFSTASRWLRRAGLDYWEGVNVIEIDNLFSYLETLSTPFYFFSSHAKKPYTSIPYTQEDHLIFGSETKGLSPEFKERWPEHFAKIPMKSNVRCLNLANAVSVVVYEGARQNNFNF
jgi:tRNA (cytidine/uridine-2'-O-)-methyltransferase